MQLFLAALLSTVFISCDYHEPDPTTSWVVRQVSDGIVLEQYKDKIHVLRISNREVKLVSNYGVCETVPKMSEQSGAVAGVNWSFAGPWPRKGQNICIPFALNKVDGVALHNSPGYHPYQSRISKITAMTVGFDNNHRYFMKELESDDEWYGMPYAVAGWPALLPESRDNWPQTANFTDNREPRTAAGLTEDGVLLLVVVDGRNPRENVIGMTLSELTGLMRDLGAVYAVSGDGGGSSTMVVDGEVVNSPSDFFHRTVADGIFVY